MHFLDYLRKMELTKVCFDIFIPTKLRYAVILVFCTLICDSMMSGSQDMEL